MKKLLSIIIAFILLFTITGCNNKKRTLQERKDGDNILLSIYSDNGSSDSRFLIKSFGHSFLTVKNLADEPIYIRDYKIEKFDELSFGAWGIDDHFGVWYDLEAQYQHKAKRYKGVVSISQYINIDKMALINDFLETHDTWTFNHNCTYLAISIWNMCVEKKDCFELKTLNSPSRLHKLIKKFDSYEKNRSMIMHEYAFTYIDGVLKKYVLEEKSYG